uniref:Uncharacterized protein n=1 Tax=Amphimedon queenslandica TaxID=400682 RepID=A0A1X7UE23_AMPQE
MLLWSRAKQDSSHYLLDSPIKHCHFY